MTYANSLSVVGDIDGGFAVLTVAGTVDLATADILRTELSAMLDNDPTTLVMDLSGVDFLASVGIQVLVETHKYFSEGCFIIVATNRVVVRPLEVTHLSEILRIVPTLTAARLALSAELDGESLT